uniref:Uncharacterized protein n=1 Tax=Arundo donax TaxID=35708 RepID=A0A0A9AZ55_ARUDO
MFKYKVNKQTSSSDTKLFLHDFPYSDGQNMF